MLLLEQTFKYFQTNKSNEFVTFKQMRVMNSLLSNTQLWFLTVNVE